MIKITNLTKSFNARPLFSNLNFNLSLGSRIGLVGRNGSGKSTLFKIILGDEYHDSGDIHIPKNYIVGALPQHIHFTLSHRCSRCSCFVSCYKIF